MHEKLRRGLAPGTEYLKKLWGLADTCSDAAAIYESARLLKLYAQEHETRLHMLQVCLEAKIGELCHFSRIQVALLSGRSVVLCNVSYHTTVASLKRQALVLLRDVHRKDFPKWRAYLAGELSPCDSASTIYGAGLREGCVVQLSLIHI